MAGRVVDLDSWGRTDQFRFFRGYQKPHFAITARVDVTHLMGRRRKAGVSPCRACLYAIGTGIRAVPELCLRFCGDVVTGCDRIDLSMTVPLPDGNFRHAYVPFHPHFATFDAEAARLIAEVPADGRLNANTAEREDLACLSCMPWLDYTSINNALPHPDDCIPRVNWEKIVEWPVGHCSMAMTLEVHHALVDGRQVGAFFAAAEQAPGAI